MIVTYIISYIIPPNGEIERENNISIDKLFYIPAPYKYDADRFVEEITLPDSVFAGSIVSVSVESNLSYNSIDLFISADSLLDTNDKKLVVQSILNQNDTIWEGNVLVPPGVQEGGLVYSSEYRCRKYFFGGK